MSTAVRQYVRSLGLDAYVVGGAVRDELLGFQHADEDFLVPGVDHAGLRAALAPHGRVDDMVVHGQLVGVRLHPREPGLRALVPAGIELTPPRAERSTGPGHRDFAIVADASISIEEDMARRDFTVNAIARHLDSGALVDPFGGLADLARRELRTVTPQSFLEDPLRILRALRLVSQLGFDLSGVTVAEMRLHARGLRHVSAERIGGGLRDDGMGELSRLLLGDAPGKALRLARETGVLAVLLPEHGAVTGLTLDSPRQPWTLDEHLIRVVQASADYGAPLAVRLAALLHDLGKPDAERDGADHAAVGAAIAHAVLRRLRYPHRLQARVAAIVQAHGFAVDPDANGVSARRFLAAHGDELAYDLVALKEADLLGKSVPGSEHEALARFRGLLEREAASPHTLAELAVDGADLLALGFREGPALGRALRSLLADVVDDPACNERAALLARAEALR